MSIWFCSDLHMNHYNSIPYCNRPFETVEEMNQALINNWNSVVNSDDTVYVLGDFIMGSPSTVKDIVSQLNGEIILVRGNHDTDKKLEVYDEVGIEVKDLVYLKDKGKMYICSHYPMYLGQWNDGRKNKLYCLSGHSHIKSPFYEDIPLNYHVGVDAHNYTPVNFEQIKNEIRQKEEELRNVET